MFTSVCTYVKSTRHLSDVFIVVVRVTGQLSDTSVMFTANDVGIRG